MGERDVYNSNNEPTFRVLLMTHVLCNLTCLAPTTALSHVLLLTQIGTGTNRSTEKVKIKLLQVTTFNKE